MRATSAEQGNAEQVGAGGSALVDGQVEGELLLTVLMQEEDPDYIILEDSAHEGVAVVYGNMDEDHPEINEDAMELESDGATWQVVHRNV